MYNVSLHEQNGYSITHTEDIVENGDCTSFSWSPSGDHVAIGSGQSNKVTIVSCKENGSTGDRHSIIIPHGTCHIRAIHWFEEHLLLLSTTQQFEDDESGDNDQESEDEEEELVELNVLVKLNDDLDVEHAWMCELCPPNEAGQPVTLFSNFLPHWYDTMPLLF